MTFWERLKQLMQETKTTQKTLSEKLNINKNSFKYWKENNNIPKYNVLEALSEYFNCSIDYLLGKSEIKDKQTAQSEQSVPDRLHPLYEDITCLSDEELQQTEDFVRFLLSKRNQEQS